MFITSLNKIFPSFLSYFPSCEITPLLSPSLSGWVETPATNMFGPMLVTHVPRSYCVVFESRAGWESQSPVLPQTNALTLRYVGRFKKCCRKKENGCIKFDSNAPRFVSPPWKNNSELFLHPQLVSSSSFLLHPYPSSNTCNDFRIATLPPCAYQTLVFITPCARNSLLHSTQSLSNLALNILNHDFARKRYCCWNKGHWEENGLS